MSILGDLISGAIEATGDRLEPIFNGYPFFAYILKHIIEAFLFLLLVVLIVALAMLKYC